MQYMKLSTSRDFRINAASLDAALQEQDDTMEVISVICTRGGLICLLMFQHLHLVLLLRLSHKLWKRLKNPN